jgi:ribosomal protein L37AE/L43A
MKKMASSYEQATMDLLVSINVCPSCESRLIRKYIEGKTITSCNKCGEAWEILQKVS